MSTIFADKFKNTSGGNNVKVNQLSGIDTAGSITIQGEGSATTNMQQGLAKVWVNYDGTASNAASRDSFNVSGMTDNGTGDATTAFANVMSSANYAVSGTSNAYGSLQVRGTSDTTKPLANALRMGSWVSSTNIGDRDYNNVMIKGDLA